MSVSTVKAMEMAARMTMGSAMAVAANDSKCPDCDHGNRDMNARDCRVAICGAPAVATLASTLGFVVRTDGVDLLVLAQLSLVGWAHAPDPYPPRPRTLG